VIFLKQHLATVNVLLKFCKRGCVIRVQPGPFLTDGTQRSKFLGPNVRRYRLTKRYLILVEGCVSWFLGDQHAPELNGRRPIPTFRGTPYFYTHRLTKNDQIRHMYGIFLQSNMGTAPPKFSEPHHIPTLCDRPGVQADRALVEATLNSSRSRSSF